MFLLSFIKSLTILCNNLIYFIDFSHRFMLLLNFITLRSPFVISQPRRLLVYSLLIIHLLAIGQIYRLFVDLTLLLFV